MNIAIIGAGAVGGALARALSRTPHSVTLGVRDPKGAAAQALAAETGATLAGPAEATADAGLVILALPWAAVEETLGALGDLTGRIVVDCTNPLGMVDGALGLLIGHGESGGERVARWAVGARVVKTLNQVGAEMMADNAGLAVRPAMFMAGDDMAAKAVVASLLAEIGFAPFDAGGVAAARLLEPFGMLWINQAILRGKGRDWAFAVVERM